MKTRYWIPFLLFIIILLSACAPAAERAPQSSGQEDLSVAEAGMGTAKSYTQGVANQPSSVVSEAGSDRIVIKNAEMEVIADDPTFVLNRIQQMAEDSGGFIVESNLYKVTTEQGLKVPSADITIRVPADRLEDIMQEIEALLQDPEQDVTHENISGQDVTAEYTDLTSRLHNLEATRDQLQKIMDAATKTEDVLAVYNQLTSINEQIEVLKGQIKYYDEAARLSSLKVHIMARESIQQITIGRWKPAGVAREAIQTLIDTLKVIANIIIWIVLYVLPTLLALAVPIGLVVWAIRTIVRNRKQKRKLTSSKPEEPQPPQAENRS